MKKILIITFVVITNYIHAQDIESKKISFIPKIELGILTQNFNGDNYLAEGHKNQSLGGELNVRFINIHNFSLGIGFNKTSINVEDTSIGGNIKTSYLNSVQGNLSYSINYFKKISIIPRFGIGGVEIRQKNGGKSYGVQNGSFYDFSIIANYKLNKVISPYLKIGYTNYSFNVNTSEEFKNYFNHSNSLNLSLGIQFL